MDERTYIEVERLGGMRLAELRARYRELFGEEARTAHKQHLVRRIAWRLQVQAQGDLSERVRQRALEIANDADLKTQVPPHWEAGKPTPARVRRSRPADRIPAAGTLLRRVYQDRTVVVKILSDGFEYEGRRFGSLSAVARAATGTRWNGLLFFGLTERGKAKHHATR
jgi:Protein of unknown function (DUF2924)